MHSVDLSEAPHAERTSTAMETQHAASHSKQPEETTSLGCLGGMLPPEQVTLIIEQMKVEQARLLNEQQDTIVQQVLKNLRESGITEAVLSKAAAKTHVRSPSKLEQSLHTLALHSLAESGLDYPHVQRSAYPAKQTSTDIRSTRPTPTTESERNGNVIIVARSEQPACSDDFVRRSGTAEEARDQDDGDLAVKCSQHSARQNAVPAKLRKSPLCGAPFTKGSQRRNTRNRPRHEGKNTGDDDDETDVMNDDFNSVRNKVGHKTLAILDRSRVLLDGMKTLTTSQSTGPSERNFVRRMRQKLADVECLDEGDRDCNQTKPPAAAERCSCPSSPIGMAGEYEDIGTQQDNCATSTQNAGAADTRTTDRLDSSNPSTTVICDDIDILRPPEQSPENENEWENELARQILTIYATSAKAKALNRPSSKGASRLAGSNGQKSRLGTSCSLPALRSGKPPSASASSHQSGPSNSSPARAAVHYSWEPSQRLHDGKVIVNMPKVPKPIWFAGTGAVKAVWCAIAEGFQALRSSLPKPPVVTRVAVAVCEHQLCEEMHRLETKHQYSQCVTTLETLLISLVRARGVGSLEIKLWKQLIVTCNAFASRCVDYKKFTTALQLIKQAEQLIHNSILVNDTVRFELRAYLYDTYAHFYYKRGKSHAGLQYMFKAQEIHTRQSSWSHLAKCRLHIANLLSSQSKHHEAMTYMTSILEMIEEKKLEDPGGDGGAAEGAASAQKICLAAVCYNNVAIEQLHLREFEAANVSSGNSKRLAKLCLSYSNRWLAQFDATGTCVDLAIATLMEDVRADANATYKP